MNRFQKTPIELQKNVLHFLLRKAQNTEFGQEHDFVSILKNKSFHDAFQKSVPFQDYQSLKKYWEKAKLSPDICWPGKIQYFAKSSGTSGVTQKSIPISDTAIKMWHREARKAAVTYLKQFPRHFLSTQILEIAESTALEDKGTFFAGYASGILIHNQPQWSKIVNKPPRSITNIQNWEERLNAIVAQAPKWNIGTLIGIPAQTQVLLQKIIDTYDLKSIHDIWPHMKLYIHGGTSFEPYKEGFKRLFKKEMQYLEVYAASEGEIAYQHTPDDSGMTLILNKGMFFEFVPFTRENFDEEGKIKEQAQSLMIDEVEEQVDYALIISTVSGAWRYLLGDLVRFVDAKNTMIHVSGRVQHFLNLAAEHVTVGELDAVVAKVSTKHAIPIREYTVGAYVENGTAYYHWFLGASQTPQNIQTIENDLDMFLQQENKEYAVERGRTIGRPKVSVIHPVHFFTWLKTNGKQGAQVKFPRVLKGGLCVGWQRFLHKENADVMKNY